MLNGPLQRKKRFYRTAYASVQECKTILRLAKVDGIQMINHADKLAAWVYNLLKSEIKTQEFSN